jgi:hypothetical protein
MFGCEALLNHLRAIVAGFHRDREREVEYLDPLPLGVRHIVRQLFEMQPFIYAREGRHEQHRSESAGGYAHELRNRI